MSVIPFSAEGPNRSVVTRTEDFDLHGDAILILGHEGAQFAPGTSECNASYDLHVGDHYQDHRRGRPIESLLEEKDTISLLPGAAAIIVTKETVQFPTTIFGHILPRVSLLQSGIANTPSKVDPGYHGTLLITVFNHGRQTIPLRRGAPFCTLYMMRVNPAARPYNRAGKQLQGPRRGRFWRRWYDWLEAHPAISTLAALVSAIAAVASWIGH